ncbi:MAG: M16 family metallopeptidase [Alphaproteobacteria bacterium]
MLIKKIFITLILVLTSCVNSKISSQKTFINIEKNIDKSLYNGAEIFLVEDNSLPIISFNLKFKNISTSYDPKDKEGLAHLTSMLMLEDAGIYTSNEIKKKFEQMGTIISFEQDLDNIYLKITCLKLKAKETFELINILFNQPKLKQEAIDIAKDKLINIVNYRNSDPSSIADNEWMKIIFNHHSYSKEANISKNTINSITRKNIEQFIKNNFSYSNLTIYIVGDINKDKAYDLFNLLNLPKNNVKLEDGENSALFKAIRTQYIIDKKFPQASIVFGQKWDFNKNDYYKAKILNYILGGRGLQSRLMQSLREEKGLTYGVHTNIEKYNLANIWQGNVAVNNKNVFEAINLIKEEIKQLKLSSISQIELDNAKTNLINTFILKLDKNSNIANILTSANLEESNTDFFKTRTENISKITLNEINDFANTVLDDTKVIFSIVGDKDLM